MKDINIPSMILQNAATNKGDEDKSARKESISQSTYCCCIIQLGNLFWE